ncbi:helix-turn-helix domain-containing protein [Winogradskyella sp. 3972H.M.0a.05]|uniref:helix-turn-helix domain-containing protein n=1 Tax=Winogradskyella sp. 3972H.M.0a.05 TaxID=2950277 RepID=UPI0033939B29
MEQEIYKASFTTWTSVFLLFSISGFVLSFILFKDKKGRELNRPIAFLVLAFSIILFQYVFQWAGYQNIYPYLYFFDHSIYLLFGPLLYTYLVNFRTKTTQISFYHFLPALISFSINAYYHFASDAFVNIKDFRDDTMIYFLWKSRSSWISSMSFLAYFFVMLDFIKRDKGNKGNTQYAKIYRRWTRALLVSFSVFIFSYISYFVLYRFAFFNQNWDYMISLSMSISIYLIGYFVYKEPEIFNGQLFSNLFLKANSNYALSEATKTEFYEKLLDHITVNESYKSNDIRLVTLADEIGLSRHVLSQIINEKSQTNFNQFINGFRLIAAEKLLVSDPDLSIKSIYFGVGFNNKATFNKVFKMKHNCTPSEYRDQKLNNV